METGPTDAPPQADATPAEEQGQVPCPNPIEVPHPVQVPDSAEIQGTTPATLRLDRQARELLECITCVELMPGPFNTCPNGHLACPRCRPRLDDICPLCRAPFTQRRNYFAEQLSEMLRALCVHCGVTMRQSETSEHDQRCDQRVVSCRAGVTAMSVPCCGWKGPLRGLREHVFQQHGAQYVYVPGDVMWRPQQEGDFMQVLLLCHNNELFWLTIRERDDFHEETIQILGTPDRATRLRIKHELYNASKCMGHASFNKVGTEDDDVNKLIDNNVCFDIPRDILLSHYVTSSGTLTGYKLSVQEDTGDFPHLYLHDEFE